MRIPCGSPMRTSAVPGLAETVIGLMPGLRRHRCECGSAHGIAAELADTEIAHLLEHVTLEIAALAGSPRTLAGETRWDFASDGRGVFRVSLEYDDDLAVLAALREGALLVASLLESEEDTADTGVGPWAVSAAVERVREVREGSRLDDVRGDVHGKDLV